MIERLDHQTSQRVFRELLGAFSLPGSLSRLGLAAPAWQLPYALLVPLALADVDVGVAVLGEEPDEAEELVSRATGARREPPERAEIVVALRPVTPGEVRALRRGRADAPELGATLVLACDRISGDARDVAVELSGPGVPGMTQLAFDGVPAEVIEALATVNAAFPVGVDVFLVAADGTLVGLPRGTRATVLSREGRWATRR